MAVEKTREARQEDASLVTPPTKVIKKSDSADGSRTKLSKEVQSKELLEPVLPEPREASTSKQTAVKAKAAPKRPAKQEQSPASAQTAAAVHQCLRRPSTKELDAAATTPPGGKSETPTSGMKTRKPKSKDDGDGVKTGKPKSKDDGDGVMTGKPKSKDDGDGVKTGKPKSTDDDHEDSMSDGDSDSVDSEEVRQKELKAKRKREAHARFMRFSRSLKSGFDQLSVLMKIMHEDHAGPC